MFPKTIILFFTLFFSAFILCMEERVKDNDNAQIITEVSTLETLPTEIHMIILEYVLGVNTTSVKTKKVLTPFNKTKNIFEVFENAKAIILKDGLNFISISSVFNNFKGELSGSTHKSLQSYLSHHIVPLMECNPLSEADQEALIQILFFYDVNVNLQNEKGDTVLIRAVATGQKKLCKFLLNKNDVEVNTQNKSKETALIVASRNNHQKIVKWLLNRKDLKIDIKDKFSRTALDYAQAWKFNNIKRMLLSAGAKQNPIQKHELIEAKGRTKKLMKILS